MNYRVAIVHLPLVCEGTSEHLRMPADAHRICADLAGLAQESFHVLSVNGKHALLNRHLISLGLANTALIHPREVFRAAMSDGATGIILVHNHPSGDPTPSADDVRITRQMVEAGKVVDIKVLDHIIVGRPIEPVGDQPGRPGYLSLRESGICSFE